VKPKNMRNVWENEKGKQIPEIKSKINQNTDDIKANELA
jgi:hypothetical protein